MEEKHDATIPYFAHEGEMARMDRMNKRLFILLLVLIFALIGTNAGWIIHEAQYKTEEYTVEVSQDTDGGGDNTFTGNTIRMIGDDENGETDDPDYSQEKSEDQ